VSKSMKKVIAAAAISLSCSASAWASSEIAWTLNQYGVGYVSSGDSKSTAFYAKDKNGTEGVFFNLIAKQVGYCKNKIVEIMLVNGKPVKFIQNEEKDGSCDYIPKTSAGMNFVMSECKIKVIIKWGDYEFSGSGFNEMKKDSNNRIDNAI